MSIKIEHIEYYLPNKLVTNNDLDVKNPQWDVHKVAEKAGVYKRYIAEQEETAFDLSCIALENLLKNKNISVNEIDGIIFCTQSPDYIMPSNAFLIHKKFNFSKNVWAFDYNLACSGYIYGLAIIRGMIMTGMAGNVLLINADTYSKYINDQDRATSVLFGDAAAVSIISKTEKDGIIDIMLASSGNEFDSFYVPAGGSRMPKNEITKIEQKDISGNVKTLENIHMNGFAVWKFISKTVPDQINELLVRNKLNIADIDLFVFHQASMLTLDSLTKALKIDANKVYYNIANVGNTVSASIPIALKNAEEDGKLKRGDLVLLSGFGVGLSWGSLIMKY
jgi:3-oxoacyl-[acyl-carrier-protein] synthase III